MSRDDFEYAIKKDIRNNPIVREVDQARQHELWRSLGIGVLLVAVLLFSAWQHFQLLRHGYDIDELERQRAIELQVNRHLRLEIETLRAPERIERIATDVLNLTRPSFSEAQILERVAPAPPPDRSVLAVRDTSALDGQQP